MLLSASLLNKPINRALCMSLFWSNCTSSLFFLFIPVVISPKHQLWCHVT